MADVGANVVFLPWVRQGAAAAINTLDTLDATLRGAVDLTAALAINAAPGIPIAVRLRGPADVVGIDPNEIVRMDPRPDTADFEPNYFPAIEFDRADFPWLFTPAKAGANSRLRPWLCLIVVRKQDGVVLRSTADAPLPSLQIGAPAKPSEELPELNESWAWAHAQVASESNATAAQLRDALAGRPERSLSRLLCPRVLQANTDYIACVVPTFELGRKAGLGLAIKDEELAGALAPAWSFSPAPAVVTLPVYHQWRFRTGAGGDFESLVRLLRARSAPEGLGKRSFAIGHPGFALPTTFDANAQLDLEGALRSMDNTALAPWSADAADVFQTALTKIVNAPGNAETIDATSDPLLAPPLYGRWHAARATVTRGAADWFDELNLDPRHRSVAAFGTHVVQEHQEALMASAWEQAADLQRANQRMRQLQLSLVVSTSLYTRHFRRLSDDAVLRVSAPAFARIRAVAAGGEVMTFAAKLNASALPLQATSAAMRRIGRERGPVTRRVVAQGVARSTAVSWVGALNASTAVIFVTPPPLPDVATFNAVIQRLVQPASIASFAEVTDVAIGSTSGRPTFQVAAEGAPVTVPPMQPLSPDADSGTARDFRNAAQAHLARVNPARMGMIFAAASSLVLRDLKNELVAQIEPKRNLMLLAQSLVATGANATPPTSPDSPIDTIMAAPKFRQPMYEPLRDLSQQLLLPGLETVLPNSVLGLQTNPRFIEAYLVGLNFEMGRELLWRGYPTDQRGTYFDQFWDARAAANAQVDVFPLHQWGTRALGDAQSAPAGERFVMLMRSDLLRRYPTAVIYAARALLVNGVRTPSLVPSDEIYPAFRGSMQPDVSFFGFDLTINQVVGGTDAATGAHDGGYFIVIQEQPTEPRFGVDVGTPMGNATHLQVSGGVPADTPTNGLQWGRNAAHTAGILRQQPVRIAIHASQFLTRRP
jgi:hypothetical protein